MSMGNMNSSESKHQEEGRIIKGKRYFEFQIQTINEEAEKFDCPFSVNTQTIFNHIGDARVLDTGLNSLRDNDIVFSKFNKCTGCNCMAFDPETISCLRCK